MPYRLGPAFALLLVLGIGLVAAENSLRLSPEEESQLSAGGTLAMILDDLPEASPGSIEDRRSDNPDVYDGGLESGWWFGPDVPDVRGVEPEIPEQSAPSDVPDASEPEDQPDTGDGDCWWCWDDPDPADEDEAYWDRIDEEHPFPEAEDDDCWDCDLDDDLDDLVLQEGSWWPEDEDIDERNEDDWWAFDDDPYFYEDEYVYVEEEPWYVQSFPGVGQFFQHVIPGAQSPTVRIPTPAPAPARAQQPAPPPARPVYAQPSCWISAKPTEVAAGGSTALQWSSFNATRARISGIGEVATAGSRTVSNITSERIYTLTVTGQGGEGSCYTRITLRQPARPASCIISANPDVIARGQPANIAWGSQSAVRASLSGTGSVNIQGGIYVRPTKTTDYTLTVYNSENRPNSCTAKIIVR